MSIADGLASLRALIDEREDGAFALLAELVNRPSGSYEAADVDCVGDRLEAAWAELGFAAVRHPVAGHGDLRLFTRRFPQGHGGRMLLLGHLDTVWSRAASAGWQYEEAEGLASGPGVGDMKGGLAAAWLAVSALLAKPGARPNEIALLLVPDEEVGSLGSRTLIEAEAQSSRCVLVLEPARPDGSVVVGRGAVGAMVLRTSGRTAHVGVNPEEGINALLPLTDLVAPITALGDALGAGSAASIGILRAGTARQVVPDAGEMHVDLRASTQAAAEALEQGIRHLAHQAASSVALTIEGGVTRPAFPRAMGEGLYRLYAQLAEAAGFVAPAIVTRGGSDGSFGAALGVPTLDGLGPICFDTCSRRERIVRASLLERALLIAALIQVLAEQPDLSLVA